MRLACLTLALILGASPSNAAVIFSCGFEPDDTWTYTATGGGMANSIAGDGDFPSRQRICDGSGSWFVSGATVSTLAFSEVLLSGWRDVKVKYRVSSTASNSTYGHGPDDSVAAYVALTEYANQSAPVFGSKPDINLIGKGRATWGYTKETPAQVVSAGWGGTFQPDSGGLRTTDGYNDFTIAIPSGKRSVAFNIQAGNDGANKYWNLDNVMLEATATASNNRWWDGDGYGPVGGGNGVWDNASATTRWANTSSANTYLAWNGANGDNAHFAQSGGLVTIAAGSTVAARSLTFSSDGYTLATGDSLSKLALTNGGSDGPGANTIDVTYAGHTAAINATIVGNPGVGLAKSGAGKLVLGGALTYTGPTIVREGTLVMGHGCSILSNVIDVRSGATLDLSTFGPYAFAGGTTIKGTGTIVGNLVVTGTHSPGNSVGIETIRGDYSMNGLLEIAIGGAAPGDVVAGYDQVIINGDQRHNVSLDGMLSLAWSGSGWSSAGDKLWIVRNDTAGAMTGVFSNYQNGAMVGNFDGRPWYLYYGADTGSGQLFGGNDLLLTAAAPIPEPGTFVLLLVMLPTKILAILALRLRAILGR